MKKFLLSAAVLALCTQLAHAETVNPNAKPLGKFGSWEAAYFMDNGDKVCYMAAQLADGATKSDKPLKERGESYLFITHWPAENEKNAVTVTAGFPIKPGTKAEVTVDGEKFTMATGGRGKSTGADAEADAQMAWMEDQKKEDDLALAISKGSKLTIKTVSKRGNNITDTYSLDGSGDAYKAISKACGY